MNFILILKAFNGHQIVFLKNAHLFPLGWFIYLGICRLIFLWRPFVRLNRNTQGQLSVHPSIESKHLTIPLNEKQTNDVIEIHETNKIGSVPEKHFKKTKSASRKTTSIVSFEILCKWKSPRKKHHQFLLDHVIRREWKWNELIKPQPQSRW